MNSFALSNIKEFQLELTTHCNAACPQCPRNIYGGEVNPLLPLVNLSAESINNTFTTEICKSLEQIFFCGSYGEPILHPNFLEIIEGFRAKSKDLRLHIHTHGGLRTPEYFEKLAKVIGNKGIIEFSIDGLEDTNHIYRKNVNFSKVINNAKAFIDAGGRATWNFIVFKHNEHQIDEAKKIADALGFEEIKFRRTGRFFDFSKMESVSEWPIHDRNGTQVSVIHPSSKKEFSNTSVEFISQIKNNFHSVDDYLNTTEIECDSLKWKKAIITAEGYVLPCTMFAHNFYDARLIDNKNILPRVYKGSKKDRNMEMKVFLEKYGIFNLNINNHSLSDIFRNQIWSDLVDSFSKTLGAGRLCDCAMTCGKLFHKVTDQAITKKEKSMLITGGNKGLGLDILNHFRGRSVSRSSDNLDILNEDSINKIAEMSLDYEVFINNAFDGPPNTQWGNFAQTNLLFKIYELWKKENKTGYIVNIGSIGCKILEAPEPLFNTYQTSKAALTAASIQCTKAFKNGIVPFKTTIIQPDRLDTPVSRARANWTGNGVSSHDVINTINYLLNTSKNTCVEEISLWVNLTFKHET